MPRILIDNFFHMPPGHRISRNITVGGYVTNFGRYSPYDVFHPNGASMLLADLLEDNQVAFSSQPFCESSLCGADILIIPNPDYPLYEGTSPYRIDEEDRIALFRFMERGGSVLMLINSFYSKSDFWEENFDIERINPLLEQLGISWDANFMSDDHRILPSVHRDFTVGYGQGGRVKGAVLPPDTQPLLSFEGDIFGFMKSVGLGKIAVIGDAGLISNGLYYFPGFDNKAFIVDLIKKLTPEFCIYPRNKFIKHSYGNISCATNENGITDNLFKTLRNNAQYRIDHHYRHLVWENDGGILTAADAINALPFDIKTLGDKSKIQIPAKLIQVCDGASAKTIQMALHVKKKELSHCTEYLITGNHCADELEWADIGVNENVAEVGTLLRVTSVIQAELAVSNGALLYASIRQGQIAYARNEKNEHYGFDVILSSKAEVYSPHAEQKR